VRLCFYDKLGVMLMTVSKVALAASIKKLKNELKAARAEILEQCRLNGMGSERELKLMAQLEILRKDIEKRKNLGECGHGHLQTALLDKDKELAELKVKYNERGIAMQETGNIVRSLYQSKIDMLNVLMTKCIKTLEYYASGQHAIDEFNDGGRARKTLSEIK
jgi:hypothetical protein